MEANVDIQKLQILNDRITQALEALDQVRFSVHGVSHTPPVDPWSAQQAQSRFAYGAPVTYGFPVGPMQGQLPTIQHAIATPSFVSPYATAMPYAGQPFQQTGLLHANPGFVQQRMGEMAVQVDPRRLAQTFPYLDLSGIATGIRW